MGIYSGTVAVTRYRVIGLKRKTSITELGSHIGGHCARGLRLSGVKQELNAGWVRPLLDGETNDQLLETDHWDLSDCRVGDGILLRLRIERRTIPSQLLQLIIKERLIKKASRRSKPLTRDERKEITEAAKEELIERALPSISYLDAYWNWQSHELMLFHTSNRFRALFEELFRSSFGKPLNLSMVRIDPPLMGLNTEQWQTARLQDDDMLQQLSLTIPTPFAEHTL